MELLASVQVCLFLPCELLQLIKHTAQGICHPVDITQAISSEVLSVAIVAVIAVVSSLTLVVAISGVVFFRFKRQLKKQSPSEPLELKSISLPEEDFQILQKLSEGTNLQFFSNLTL
jgi:hypothetical protein